MESPELSVDESPMSSVSSSSSGSLDKMADPPSFMCLTPRPLKPFSSSDEYLYAMKEDLADWLHKLYNLDIDVDNFFDRLETGIVICHHPNCTLEAAIRYIEKQGDGTTTTTWGKRRHMSYRTNTNS